LGHDRRYSIDCAKIEALGWRPVRDFAMGLDETVRWYRENEGWWRPSKRAAVASSRELVFVPKENQ
jgi:dTDP-glucose 4,6-dehydratase